MNSDKLVECCWCKVKSPKSEMNFLLGKYSHKNCDDSYFDKQERSVKKVFNQAISLSLDMRRIDVFLNKKQKL